MGVHGLATQTMVEPAPSGRLLHRRSTTSINFRTFTIPPFSKLVYFVQRFHTDVVFRPLEAKRPSSAHLNIVVGTAILLRLNSEMSQLHEICFGK
jgi:hypothetical protein